MALFDSGSSIGAALAPFIALAVYQATGSWRPAFIVTGALGFLWLPLFRWLYRSPEEHPRISPGGAVHPEQSGISGRRAGRWRNRRSRIPPAFSLPQTWGIIIGKALTDPVWFFITDWFAIYLVSRGFKLEDSLLAFWVRSSPPISAIFSRRRLERAHQARLVRRRRPQGRRPVRRDRRRRF